jgi:XRE family transcriptional regulator, regulator of sulfur utilization
VRPPGIRTKSHDDNTSLIRGDGVAVAPDDELVASIRDRLKQLRVQAGLSLERLSKLCGVSRAMLSQIELGRSVPTITVLSRIAVAFHVPVSAFFALDSRSRVHLIRLNQTQHLRSSDGSFVSRALFPLLGARNTEFYELRLESGCHQESEPHTAGTTENLVLTSGELAISVGGLSYQLAPGDALYFGADVPHAYRNCGAEPALAYLVMTYLISVNY